VKGGLCWVSAKSEVTAGGARYFFLLDAEFFEDGLFFLEMVNGLEFLFFLPLSSELLLADASTEPLDFLVLLREEEGALVFLFVEGARLPPPSCLVPRIGQSIAIGGRLFFGDRPILL
jgi:hypothetical protein